MVRHWRVVAGEKSGGIVAREGQERTSDACASRLGFGAVVEEIGIVQGRMKFEKVDGAGPSEGWVKTTLKGKELLVQVDGVPLPRPVVSVMSKSAPLAPVALAATIGPRPPPRGKAAILALAIANAKRSPGIAWKDLLKKYRSGALDTSHKEYHNELLDMATVMLDHTNGKASDEMDFTSPTRSSGLPNSWTPKPSYKPPSDSGSSKRLLLHGDSITHGAPTISNSASFALALAKRNPDVFIENAGWGGLMSMSLLRPGDFDIDDTMALPIPKPSEFKCDLACIMIGTNDAMAISGGDGVTKMLYTGGAGGRPQLPEDFVTKCKPSAKLYEQSVLKAVQELKAANPGVRIALVTPPLLAEDVSDEAGAAVAEAPYVVLKKLAAAVHRIAKDEGCTVLPLLECMAHHIEEQQNKGRKPIKWTGTNFMRRGGVQMQEISDCTAAGKPTILDETGKVKDEIPIFCPDLCHMNERGAALYATLCQEWLNVELSN